MTEAKKNYLKVVKDVSLTLNVPKNTVEHVLLYVFGRIREGVERRQYESFFIRNIGTFSVSDAARTRSERIGAIYKLKLANEALKSGTGNIGGTSVPSVSGDGETQPDSGSNVQGEDVQLSSMPVVSELHVRQDKEG